jgi:hypothetical protein
MKYLLISLLSLTNSVVAAEEQSVDVVQTIDQKQEPWVREKLISNVFYIGMSAEDVRNAASASNYQVIERDQDDIGLQRDYRGSVLSVKARPFTSQMVLTDGDDKIYIGITSPASGSIVYVIRRTVDYKDPAKRAENTGMIAAIEAKFGESFRAPENAQYPDAPSMLDYCFNSSGQNVGTSTADNCRWLYQLSNNTKYTFNRDDFREINNSPARIYANVAWYKSSDGYVTASDVTMYDAQIISDDMIELEKFLSEALDKMQAELSAGQPAAPKL